MTEGTERLQRDLEGALIMLMVLVDTPYTVPEDETMYRAVIKRLVPHLTYRTLYARELVYAFEDYEAMLADPETAPAWRRVQALHALKLKIHGILRRRLSAVLERLEAGHGLEIRGKGVGAMVDEAEPGPEAAGGSG